MAPPRPGTTRYRSAQLGWLRDDLSRCALEAHVTGCALQRLQVNELRAELAKFRRQNAHERDVADGSTAAQLEQLKRLVARLDARLSPTLNNGLAAEPPADAAELY